MVMTKLKIRLYGDPCLRKKSLLVKSLGPSERILINFLLETMHHYKGVGLAAPQLGINQRIFVVDLGEGPIAVINPRILKWMGSVVQEEGCLSIPGVNLSIKRPETIKVEYRDENDKPIEREFTGLLARVFQHEYDHLQGKLIVDYLSWQGKKKIAQQLKELEKKSQLQSGVR